MRSLIIDDKARVKIKRVLKHAEANFIDLKQLEEKYKNPNQIPVGDDPNFVCELEDGYRIVCSIERQYVGWTKHLSISINSKDKLPSIASVRFIIKEFGINDELEKCFAVYIEDSVPKSINIIAKI